MRSSSIGAIAFVAAVASSCALVLGDFDTKGQGGTAGTGGAASSSSTSATHASSSGVTGCKSDADCNDGNPCHAHVCTTATGKCDNGAIPDGPVPGYVDMVKDCKTQKCVGGMEQTVPDGADAPSSGNPCATDSCMNGMVLMTNASAGTACGNMQVCDGQGHCGCTKTSDCADPGMCKSVSCTSMKCIVTNDAPETPCPMSGKVCDGQGNCVGCVTNGDCSSGNCQGGTCGLADNGHPCTAGNQCQSGHCVQGVCCDAVCDGTCMACSGALTGQPDGACAAVQAGTQAPAGQCSPTPPCGNDGTCDGMGGCAQLPSGTACGPECTNDMLTPPGSCDGMGSCSGTPAPCPGNFTCASPTDCATSCPSNDAAGDALCTMGYWCDGNACQSPLPSGASCDRDVQCMNGACNAAVCP
jgi:hypothetical protein